MTIKPCSYPGCHREAKYFMGWTNENGKHFGLVCATCDRKLGRCNLMKIGMSLQDCIKFEKYLKLTVDDTLPIDFSPWLKTHKQDLSPLETLDLSPRALNALRRHGITTIEELAGSDAHELYEIRMLGQKSISEVLQRLEEHRHG